MIHEKIVVIENKFREMDIDGASLVRRGVSVKKLYAGCICYTFPRDFRKTIEDVVLNFSPERIIIEPSGVGKLSEVIKACKFVAIKETLHINMKISVVDVQKFQMYLMNFDKFFEDQIKNANTIFLGRTEKITQEGLVKVIEDANCMKVLPLPPRLCCNLHRKKSVLLQR